MPLGSITYHIDFPTVAIWLFFGAFSAAGIVLRTLDKREGYPMRASPFDARPMQGFPPPPAPVDLPSARGRRHGGAASPSAGADLGRAALSVRRHAAVAGGQSAAGRHRPWRLGDAARRADVDGKGRADAGAAAHSPEWSVETGEADPRGMAVLDRRYRTVGVVHDVWVDKSIKILRLFEVELHAGLGRGRVLVPIFHTDIEEKAREVRVTALEAHQFADVPMPAEPDEITAREDDRLNAYFAAGYFYRDTAATFRPAMPERAAGGQATHEVSSTCCPASRCCGRAARLARAGARRDARALGGAVCRGVPDLGRVCGPQPRAGAGAHAAGRHAVPGAGIGAARRLRRLRLAVRPHHDATPSPTSAAC